MQDPGNKNPVKIGCLFWQESDFLNTTHVEIDSDSNEILLLLKRDDSHDAKIDA